MTLAEVEVAVPAAGPVRGRPGAADGGWAPACAGFARAGERRRLLALSLATRGCGWSLGADRGARRMGRRRRLLALSLSHHRGSAGGPVRRPLLASEPGGGGGCWHCPWPPGVRAEA